MKLLVISLVLVVAVNLFSCDYSRTSGGLEDALPQAGFDDPKPGEEPAVRFADVRAAVLESSCAGCHQNRGLDLSFSDYANTKPFAAEIFVRVFEDRDMPPKKKLTALQEQVLRTWLDSGSPE